MLLRLSIRVHLMRVVRRSILLFGTIVRRSLLGVERSAVIQAQHYWFAALGHRCVDLTPSRL